MDAQELIKLTIEFILVTGVGWILKNMLTKVTKKLDEVLSNQQAQEVTIAEIKKDVHRMTDDTRVIGSEQRSISKRVNQLEIDVSALKAASNG